MMKEQYGQITLGQSAKFIRGITFKPDDLVSKDTDNAVVCMRTKNVQSTLDEKDLIAIPSEFVKRHEQYLQTGDILVSTANSWELVGKCCWVPSLNYKATAGGFITILRAKQNRLFPRYLYHWASLDYTQHLLRNCGRQTTNISNMDIKRAEELNIPIPFPDAPQRSLSEQKRIAAILDKADDIRKKRRQTIEELDNFIHAIFNEYFCESITNKLCHKDLVNIADIVSGVTKGRKFNGKPTVMLPYIRVANVQAGYLDLTEIKEIEALPEELEQYRLMYGDVLLTEGGDFDKLGRGTMWEGQIENCIHQNHIFRVRVNKDIVLPEYFDIFLQTHLAKAYFLKCAKKTSNLASINMTQLRKLPVPIPKISLQRKFTDVYHKHNNMTKVFEKNYNETNNLFNSLVQRAFKGEL